jgi:AcrR family transcriptional regulator
MRRRTHGPVTSRGERSRNTILRAAISVFARDGYRGAALATVADAADLTQPGLLHHFPSKERLLTAVLAERDEEDTGRLREAWSRNGHDTLTALHDLVAHNATQRDLVQLFTVLVGEGVSAGHPAHPYFVDRYERVREATRSRLAASQADGAFRSDLDPEAVATLLIAVMDGLQIQWLLNDRIDMVAAFDLFVAVLSPYLAAPGRA